MKLSPENPNRPITNENQIDLFPDLPTTEEVVVTETPEIDSTETEAISPTAAFKALVGTQQDPLTYGLDTDQKILDFIKRTEGSNPYLALAALTRELEDKDVRADLR